MQSRAILTVAVAALVAGCGGAAALPGPAPKATSPAATAEAPLLGGPLAPVDPDLFGPPYYPDAAQLAPAPGPPLTAEEALAEARSLVAARSPELAAEAGRLYGDPRLMERIPDPGLRAAAVSLLGTIAQPALDWLLDGPFVAVELGSFDGPAIARSFAGADGQRIVVHERFRAERPGLLSVVLAHEALHADGEASDVEELIATALQALVHLQQLLADPTLAAERTELAQSVDAWTLIRLNTRARGSAELRLVLADGGPSVLPGGLDRPYFAAFFDPGAPATPGNPYLAALLAAVAPDVAVSAAPGFDIGTVRFLDANQGVLGDGQLARGAALLGLGRGAGA